jgi:hypothetical protein
VVIVEGNAAVDALRMTVTTLVRDSLVYTRLGVPWLSTDERGGEITNDSNGTNNTGDDTSMAAVTAAAI